MAANVINGTEFNIRHLDGYRESKLKIASGGSEGHLSEKQTQALMQHLEEHTYHYVHDIITYIKTTWSVLQCARANKEAQA